MPPLLFLDIRSVQSKTHESEILLKQVLASKPLDTHYHPEFLSAQTENDACQLVSKEYDKVVASDSFERVLFIALDEHQAEQLGRYRQDRNRVVRIRGEISSQQSGNYTLSEWIDALANQVAGRDPSRANVHCLAVILCTQPSSYPMASPSGGDLYTLEDPSRLTPELIKSVLTGLCPDDDFETRDRSWPSGLGPELLPSRWGGNSLLVTGVRNIYTGTAHLALMGREFPDNSVRTLVEALWDKEDWPLSERHAYVADVMLHVLQICRRLATFTVEGRPFQCAVLLTFRDWRPPPEFPLLFEIHQDFTFQSITDLKQHAEMSQSDDLLLLVDMNSCRLRGIYQLPRLDEGENPHYCRIDRFRCLSKMAPGVIVHMRVGGVVEVFNRHGLQVWFDGYSWGQEPYTSLRGSMQQFFEEQPSQGQHPTTLKLLGAISHLLDRHASSILVLTSESLDTLHAHGLLKQHRKIRLVYQSVQTLSMDALVSLLRVDGAHVINLKGELVGVTQEILVRPGQDENPSAPGSGSYAAMNLSGRLESGFVVKVSASREVRVYWKGRRLTPSEVAQAHPRPS